MLTMKEMEEKTGLTSYTLRYYEKERIIIPSRKENDHRVYTEADVEWILFVKQLRELDIPIEAICEYAELMRQGSVTLEERIAFLVEQDENVKLKIKELNQLEKILVKQIQQLKKEKKKEKKQ